MKESEAILLARFASGADAEAFAELVRRYARMVYSTAWRVLKDEGEATDVTQETFFELTRKAGRISGSLGCWLHRVATQKSIDVIRRSVRQRRREQGYARSRPIEVDTWQDLSEHVDRALDTLDESLKVFLLEHFINGKTTSQIAREQGISQATVSRRIHAGLEKLRSVLRRKGLLVTATALGTMLTENTAQAVSETLLASLGKMAMVGTTRSATATVTKASAVKALVTTTGIVGVISVGAYVHQRRTAPHPAATDPPIAPQAQEDTQGRAATSSRGGQAVVEDVPRPVMNPETDEANGAPPERLTLNSENTGEGASFSGGTAIGWVVGGVQDAVDLSTPAAAVYSLLYLIDEEEMDKRGLCLLEEDALADGPYPQYVGHPIRLMDVFEEGSLATVQWQATAHTAFDYADQRWAPGQYVPFTSHLVLDENVWKIAVFIE